MSARVKAVRARRDLADAIFDMESTVREPLNLLDALVMAIEGAEIDKRKVEALIVLAYAARDAAERCQDEWMELYNLSHPEAAV